MNLALQFLDKFDRDNNIYDLIMTVAEQAHKKLQGGLGFEEDQGETLRGILEQVIQESGEGE